MSLTRTGRRALSVALTTALAGTTLFVLQGTSNAAPSASGTASPASGAASVAAGTIVAVTGTGFKDAAGALAVKNGVTAPTSGKLVASTGACADATASVGVVTYSVASATRIIAKMPSHAAGAVKACFPVFPHTATGWVTVPYAYAAQPVLGTVSTPSGPAYGGQTVTITASPIWRANSTVATINGVAATNVKVTSDGTSLSFVTPAATGGPYAIVVKTPGFADVTAAAAYTYQNAIKVSPSLVDPTGGDTLDIVGSGFSALTAAGVWLDDASSDPACTNVQVVSDSEITCDVPAHTAESVSVVVGEDVDGTLANATSTNVVTSGSTVTISTY